MKAIVKYPGGKWRIAKWIISFFPDYHSYLEPFFGSGAVLFNKPRSNIETVNDLDGNVVNLFEWIRRDPERLAHEIYFTPYARRIFEGTYYREPENSLKQAVSFCIRLNMGYGFRTNGERVGWKSDIQGRERNYDAKDWCSLPERLLQASERLRGVQIENRPAVEVIRKFNHPNVLIYADPPYVLNTRRRKQYRCEMDDKEHEELLDALLAHKGPVLISGYENELYQDRLCMWRKETTENCCQSTEKRTEVLWMNFEAGRQLSLELFMKGEPRKT